MRELQGESKERPRHHSASVPGAPTTKQRHTAASGVTPDHWLLLCEPHGLPNLAMQAPGPGLQAQEHTSVPGKVSGTPLGDLK